MNPNWFESYEYILCYVDDVLCISSDPGKSMNTIQYYFRLKYDNIVEPDVYLVAKMYMVSLEGGKKLWKVSTDHYIHA